MTTRAKELAKVLSPDQMKALAGLLAEEADRPRIDRRRLSRLERAYLAAYAKARLQEEELKREHLAYGISQAEIEAAVEKLKSEAERRKASLAAKPRVPRAAKKA